MGRTRLFHTIVIVGSSLLANCEKGPVPVKKSAVKDAADLPQIMVAPPPDPPRIHAMTPEKMGQGPDAVRIMAIPPPRIIAPPPVRVMKAPPPPKIQVRRPKKKPPPRT